MHSKPTDEADYGDEALRAATGRLQQADAVSCFLAEDVTLDCNRRGLRRHDTDKYAGGWRESLCYHPA